MDRRLPLLWYKKMQYKNGEIYWAQRLLRKQRRKVQKGNICNNCNILAHGILKNEGGCVCTIDWSNVVTLGVTVPSSGQQCILQYIDTSISGTLVPPITLTALQQVHNCLHQTIC